MSTNKLHGHVVIENLCLSFKTFSLKNVNLDISAGEYFVLLGPTGSGKTVFLETIAGLHPPESGHIRIDGEDITRTAPENRGIGFVYQDYALFPHLTVARNITFGLAAKNRSRAQRIFPMFGITKSRRIRDAYRDQLDEIAGLLRIEHLLQRRPQSLSGGEKQRVALARALVVHPRVMLLDEPLSALDPERREELQRELMRIHLAVGTTIIHVTHDFEEAISLGDRIAVMHGGKILQTGTPETIFRRPASEFIARFVGVRNVFPAEIKAAATEETVLLAHNGLEVAALTRLKGKCHFSIRPEDIILSKEMLQSSARNHFPGTVTAIANRGMLVYITIAVKPKNNPSLVTQFICAITHRSHDEMALETGDKVTISFKASAVHVF